MATVTTTTQTDVVAPPNLAAFARDMSTGSLAGRLYVLVRTATDTLSLYRSLDSGASWSLWSSFTHTGLQEWSSLVIDRSGYAHVAYRIGTATVDSLWYRRGSLSSASWSSGLIISASTGDANGGVIGSRWQGVDLGVVRNSNGTYSIYIAGAYSDTTPRYGIWTHGVSIDASGNITNNDGLITNNRIWLVNGTSPGRSGVTVEVEHNGDGFTSTTPNMWVAYGREKIRMVKLAWQGSTAGWAGPTDHQALVILAANQDYAAGRWDGLQWMMPIVSPDDNTIVRVIQRNKANTVTTTFDTPQHPQGAIRQLAIGYDATTHDIRVYAVGTTTAVLYYVDYDRSGATWGSWATVVATAILGTNASEFGVRRGGSSGDSRLDVVTAASGSPNTITHTAQTVAAAPSIAVWNTSGQPYLNGGAADVNTSLTLDWDFSDPDPGDTQGSYALSRQIGTGAVQYYTAAGGTWGGTEVQNSTGTTNVTLASGWAAGTDANYTFKVKVWDSTNTPASDYSAALILIPSVKVNPTITAPTAAQVLGVNSVTATWTVSEQTQYRVQLNVQGGGIQVYDSGWVTSTAATFTVPYNLQNGTLWTLTLTTKNNEGLASTAQTVNFSVSYTQPAAPTLVQTPLPVTGVIHVAITNPVVTGTQPAVLNQDLWRRVVANTVLNSNPYFEVDLSGWFQINSTGTRSTAFAHQGVASCHVVPNGTSADCYEESNSVTVDQTLTYQVEGWIRPDTSNKPVALRLTWYNGASFIAASVFSVNAVAGAWQYVVGSAPASNFPTATKVGITGGVGNTPAVTDTCYLDEMKLTVFNSDTGIRVAAGLASGATVDDWKTSALVNYEYQVVTTGVNGTSIVGPWTQ